MFRIETKELSLSGAGLPFGDFLSVLQARVEDVAGAAPNLGLTEVSAVHFG